MPQFDSHFFTSQIFWLCVCFGVLWAAMHWWIVPQIRGIQKKRNTHMNVILKEAQMLNEKSTEIRVYCDAQKHQLEESMQHRLKSVSKAQEIAMAEHLIQLKHGFDLKMSEIKKELASMQEEFVKHVQENAMETARQLIQTYQNKEEEKHDPR